jgi:synaptobrevin family protein YKT6
VASSPNHAEEYLCHVTNRQGLVGVAVVDKEYPTRAAFSVIQKVRKSLHLTTYAVLFLSVLLMKHNVCLQCRSQVTDEYLEKHGYSWRSQRSDSSAFDQQLTELLSKYQDPANADKLVKVQNELDETKVVLHKTIDSVLERGEKLDNLVDKSSDLSMASQMFYKQARRHNQCCRMS